jgi:sirohydrochlorin ferrochelatase
MQMKFHSAFPYQNTSRTMSARAFIPLLLVFCAAGFFAGVSSAQAPTHSHIQKSAQPSSSVTGILLMAHGGGKDWNGKVNAVAAEVDNRMPTEVALGMADRATLQAGVDKLTARGVTQIVAVPLFVSSHSSVIESTKYLLGLRAEGPKDLAGFAMDDMPNMAGAPKAPSAANSSDQSPHARTTQSPATDAKPELPKPIKSSVPLRMVPALDHHPIVAQILADRAAAIAKNPSHDVLILVAHGPNDDGENAQWLADMNSLVKQMSVHANYVRIEFVTLRDDADGPIREQATADLRKAAQSADEDGYHVLIVPLLLSYGGIENGLRQRLDGVEHTLSPQGLLPDPRIAQWVLESAQTTQSSQFAN